MRERWRKTAVELAAKLYAEFLEQVVEQGVLTEREGVMSEEQARRTEKGTHVDVRVVRLMAISGKGGWSPDPTKRLRYEDSYNVTLLDHLLSVARGAMLIAALDWLAENPDLECETLERRLRAVAVVGFLHDADKVLGLERGALLGLSALEGLMTRYRIAAFLAPSRLSLSPEQLRYLIEKVEASQSFKSLPSNPPDRAWEVGIPYVALADKLDGAWLSSNPETGGVAGVLKRLQADQALRQDFLRDWHVVEIFDPHHPFLLDEFQRWVSCISEDMTGVPPLIEAHQDGRLVMLLPVEDHEAILSRAVGKLAANLPFQLELNVSNRGVPSLYNGKPDLMGFRQFISAQPLSHLGRLFLLKADLKETITPLLDALLGVHGLAPKWPKTAGALLSPFAMLDAPSETGKALFRQAAELALLMNLKLEVGKKAGVPDYVTREEELLAVAGHVRPDWVTAIGDDASRRAVLALWAAVLSLEDAALREAIWGDQGLLYRWLEGTGDRPGMNAFITGRGAQVTAQVATHFQQLLAGVRIQAEDETALGRCLFTDRPVPFDEPIDDALGLYQVRVSAFSGRDNRPETLTSERSHTVVSPVSIAEHKLRAQAHEQQGGKPSGVPTLISSPTTSGLFGGLGFRNEGSLAGRSIYDMSRQDVKKGTVYTGLEGYHSRIRFARLERMEERAEEQVNQLRLLLVACRRMGRPIHVFRGLPTHQRAFFHYDAMPRILADLIGGCSLRLEQIPSALKQIEIARILLESNGLGYEALRMYAVPSSRFAAVCLAWCHLRGADASRTILQTLEAEFLRLKEMIPMHTPDDVMVRLGRAAAGIQRATWGKASANEEMLVFKICFDAADAASAVGQSSPDSLAYAIASELETNLVRKEKAAGRQHRQEKSLRDGCLEVAEMFVQEVWLGVLKQHAPSQRNRRILGSIYRMAFLQGNRQQSALVESN